jgi:DNA-binding MurR/RpiR family transcriptional regulator
MGTVEQDHIAQFTRELLGTGLWLRDLAAELAESIPEEAYPGEESGEVVIEMVTGTIRSPLADTDPQRLVEAVDLIATARERVIEHLRLALELSKRMQREDDEWPRPAYG